MEFDWPVTLDDHRRVAAMTVTGLRDGFRISDPADLSYRGWVAATGNTPLYLPSLGLSRAD